MRRIGLSLIAVLLAALGIARTGLAAETRLRPYVLASQAAGPFEKSVASTRQALQGAGLEIAGEYPVSAAAHVFVVTSPALKKTAAGSDLGGYGAAMRVSVTAVGAEVQVAFTNPAWVAAVYRMGDLAQVSARLESALGKVREFGSQNGRTERELRSYHYMMMMPYFTDQVLLGEFAGHADALERVNRGLSRSPAVKLVARVDVPGKEETLFSVAILTGDGADAAILRTTDTGALRHTAYLPYELLVSGKKVLMLHGKFRIAQSFPDLSMGTFMKISGAPGGIEEALRTALK